MTMQNEPQLSVDTINLTLKDLKSGEIDLDRATVEIEYIIEQSVATALEEQRKDVAKIAQNLFPITGENAKKHNKAVLRLSNYALNGKGTE